MLPGTFRWSTQQGEGNQLMFSHSNVRTGVVNLCNITACRTESTVGRTFAVIEQKERVIIDITTSTRNAD